MGDGSNIKRNERQKIVLQQLCAEHFFCWVLLLNVVIATISIYKTLNEQQLVCHAQVRFSDFQHFSESDGKAFESEVDLEFFLDQVVAKINEMLIL